jgi:hypothetical protein
MGTENKNVVCVMGEPNSGKSTSLRNMDLSKVVYLNPDNKEPPFKGKFMANMFIERATDVPAYIRDIEANPDVLGGVIDTVTKLMEMYERQMVVGAANGQQAWGEYGNFCRQMIHQIKTGTKDYVVFAHEDKVLNEQRGVMESKIPIKGSVGKIGLEADFSIILASVQVPLKKLEGHKNDLLTVTPEEEQDGVKYVFVTRITKEFAGGKMRAPMGLWGRDELYIDNDLKKVFTRLKDFYGK